MKKIYLMAGVIVIALIAVLLIAGIFSKQSVDSGQLEQVTIAYSPYESTALLWIAEDQHFFEKNRLNVTLRKYDSGAGSLDGVLKGEADVTVGVTEFPFTRTVLKNSAIRAIGTIDKGDFTSIVASKDRGIKNISDLKGKRIGTASGTIAEFYLMRFLQLHGIKKDDIIFVDVKTPDGWINDVANGNIDAIAVAQPYVNAARDRLGDTAIVWPIQSNQPVFALIVTTDEWLSGNPGTAEKLLRSFSLAEEYVIMHPDESQAIVEKRLNFSKEYTRDVWRQNQFSLSLDQSLIMAMEDEARWLIQNNLTNTTYVPDFRKYLYTDGLDHVKPGSVLIIR